MLRRLVIVIAALVSVIACAAPGAGPVALVAEGREPVATGGMATMKVGGDPAFVPAEAVEAYRAYLTKGICDDYCPEVVKLSAAKMPFVTRNIKTAVAAGKPFALTKVDKPTADANRKAACRGFNKHWPDGSCDEYPFASSQEGGAGSSIEEVPLREQNCKGGTIRGEYARAKIQDGDRYAVIILRQDLIAKGQYQGVDIALDRGLCE